MIFFEMVNVQYILDQKVYWDAPVCPSVRLSFAEVDVNLLKREATLQHISYSVL